MRRAKVMALAFVLIAAPAASAARSSSDAPPPSGDLAASSETDQGKPAAPPKGQRLLSPRDEGRQGLVKGVVEQPIRDLNLMQSHIPPVLEEAMQDPYERASPPSCEGLAFQIRRLDDALGPDLDQPVSTDHPSMLIRGEGSARDYGYDALRAGVQSYIPFDRYIRLLSGADRHDRRVLAAIQAGAVRRAYLKGIGEVRGCPPPSVPLHLAHPVTVATDAYTKPR